MKEGEMWLRLEISLVDGKALEGLLGMKGQPNHKLIRPNTALIKRIHLLEIQMQAEDPRTTITASCCSPKRREVEVELMSSTSSKS
jgi:hypothetical protein